MKDFLLTSESVTEGHPDKICDQISDAFLDEALRQDKNSRVAVECITTTGMIFIAGEMTTKGWIDAPKITRRVLQNIGYTNPEFGLDCYDCAVITAIHEQSQNIAVGVDSSKKHEQGAGDQGCIAQGSLIRTARGFIPIEQVMQGDVVITPFGPKKVLAEKYTGQKQTVKIEFSNGFTLQCTPDHRILCFGPGKLYWKEAASLNEDDFICHQKPYDIFPAQYARSKVEKKQFFSKYNHKIYGSEDAILDEKIGYLLGELIGDGFVAKKNVVSLAFGNNYGHAASVHQMLNEKFPDQWKRYHHPKDNSVTLVANSLMIRKHLEQFGLAYKKSPQKTTPCAIYTSPRSVVAEYIKGLFDSDGTIVTNTGRNKNNIRIRLCSSSLKLLQESQLLLNDFEIKSSILFNRPKGTPVGKNKKYKSNFDNYVLSLSGFDSYQNFGQKIGFRDEKKMKKMLQYLESTREKPRNSRGLFLIPHKYKDELIDENKTDITFPFALTRIKKISPAEKVRVYDLEIEGIHMFSANGIYVHNSMFGYACNETPELMPLPIMLAHRLARRLAEVRKKKILPWVRPDGKSQVTIQYENGRPKRIDAVVIAVHHNPEISRKKLRSDIIETVIKPICGKMMDRNTKIFINETGIFVVGGPEADTGLTGRKIIVDTYGGAAPHGGGAFCVSGDSIVNTQYGLAPIEELKDIKHGTLIKTDISPCPVDQWLDNGIKETMIVETTDGYRLEGTFNQCIRVVDADGNYIWRRMDQLESNDWIAIQRKNRMFGDKSGIDFAFQHKKGTYRKNNFHFPSYLTEDYAYLMGLLVGDGRCTTRDGVQLCVCEEEMKTIVVNLFKKLFGSEGKIFGHWAFFCGVELRSYLDQLGLGYLRSWEKIVPKTIWKAPRPVVAAFIRGLFDTDGTVRKSGRNNTSLDIKLATTSQKLALGIQQLLLNFGIICNIQTVDTRGKKSYIKKRKIVSKHILYHVRIKGYHSIRAFQEEIGFGLLRKSHILNSIQYQKNKRNLFTLPNQKKRIKLLWDKLSSSLHQEDKAKIGRLLRNQSSKSTKELTYEKLAEFLDAYEDLFHGDPHFETLKSFYILNHYYTRVKNLKKSRTHVYDFTVPAVHTFVANGFVCHNSGKDPSKVDRSATYAARYIAKNIVAAGLAEKCLVQLSYSIGVAEPVSISIDTFGTGKLPEERLSALVRKHFPVKPADIIRDLKLLRPIYLKTAAYGHFGRSEPEFTWEKTDKAALLKRLI